MKSKPVSGLNVEAFCKSRGISKHQYYYWQRELREAALEDLIENSSGLPVAKVFTEVTVAEPVKDSYSIGKVH
jgi:transposase-like protein